MSSLMSELLFSPAPKVNSPGASLGGFETHNPAGDSFRKSFEQETRATSRTDDRPLASESRSSARVDKGDTTAQGKPYETQDKATVESGQPASKKGEKSAGRADTEEKPREDVAEETVATDPVAVAHDQVKATGNTRLTEPDGKATPVSAQQSPVKLNTNGKAEPASVDTLAQGDAVLNGLGQSTEGKAGGLVSALAAQPAGKPLEATVVTPQAFPLTMQAAAGKGLKLDAWQFGRIETGAKVPAAELADAGVKTPSPSTFHGAMANVMNSSSADISSARMQVPVNISFGQPQWAGMVAERSAWLFSQNISNAELVLDPPELGRVTVHVQVHNQDQASVTFTSANANVRDALDQSSQRLRELLSDQGMNLVNVDVSDRQPAQDQREHAGGGGAASLDQAEVVGDEPAPAVQISLNAGVDYYV